MSKQRAVSLDVLRGLAIIGMVLSSTEGAGLPAWMHHAQEPPPDFVYHPEITGITWVDVVFPLFLLAMGAAFPFSIGRRLEKGETRLRIVGETVGRFLKLAFFAVYVQHFYPYMLAPEGGVYAWGWAMVAFFLLFPMFMRIPYNLPSPAKVAIKVAAYVAGIVMLFVVKDADGTGFNVAINNPILMILANMALLGGIIYLLTKGSWVARMAVCLVVAALDVGVVTGGGWQNAVAAFTPVQGVYKFDYLLYLLIVLPGSIAGEWVRDGLACEAKSRQLMLRLLAAGAFMIVLGLLLEPFHGGIRKDPPTLGYLMVTGGIGFIVLDAFYVLCDRMGLRRGFTPLSMAGQNPMVAYVACDLLIYPLCSAVGILAPIFAFCSTSPWLALLQGVVFTSLVVLLTMAFTRIKWFWRT